MDPIKGILDEPFFSAASDTCLEAMSKLVDDMFALHLQKYISGPSAQPAIVERINLFLGEAIKKAMFHTVLQERGSCDVVRKIQLAALPSMSLNIGSIITELEFLHDNYSYVAPYIEPRHKEDYEAFLSLAPSAYVGKIEANKIFFYQPGAVRRSTGMRIIIERHDDWEIALKGLKTLRYFTQQGLGINNYITAGF